MAVYTYLLIITCNVNGLECSNKRHRVTDWIEKLEHTICCLQETHFRCEKECNIDTYYNMAEPKKLFFLGLPPKVIEIKMNINRWDQSNL